MEELNFNNLTPHDRYKMMQGVKENPLLHYVLTDGEDGYEVGILGDTHPEIQISGFGTDTIPVSEHKREKEMFAVYITDTSGKKDPQSISDRTQKTIVGASPLMVGREEWQVGFGLVTDDGGVMLIAKCNVEDSKTVYDILLNKGEIGLVYRAGEHEHKNQVVPVEELKHFRDKVGTEIDEEFVFNNLAEHKLEKF